jgi:hypothetical protein
VRTVSGNDLREAERECPLEVSLEHW